METKDCKYKNNILNDLKFEDCIGFIESIADEFEGIDEDHHWMNTAFRCHLRMLYQIPNDEVTKVLNEYCKRQFENEAIK